MKHEKPHGLNINTIASMIPLTVDLGDERAVLDVFRDIALTDGVTFKDIYANLDFIIETARVQRRYELARDAMTGAAMFAPLIALTSFATLIPTDAMAATLGGSDWPSVALRFVLTVALFGVACGLVSLAVMMMFPKRLDTFPDDDDAGDIESRRRNAGGE